MSPEPHDHDPNIFGKCKHPEVMADTVRGGLCKWPMSRVNWSVAFAQGLGSLSADQVHQAFAIAWGQWAQACGLDPQYVADATKANILAHGGEIDGPGNTLAESELPCGVPANAQLSQTFDTAEAWDFDMLVAVAAHETGHAIGLPHLAAGNLMQPYYSRAITAPQPGDIQEARQRYGIRITPQPPAPPAPKAPAPARPTGPVTAGELTVAGQAYFVILVPKG